MKNNFKIILLVFSFFSFLVFSQSYVSAELDCQTREECEALLKEYEKEISRLEGVVVKTEQEQKTIQSQINLLKSTIQKLDLQIEQGNIIIKDLGYQIKEIEGSIDLTTLKINSLKNKLTVNLQTVYEESQKSFVELLFSGESLTDFFNNLMALETLNYKNQEFLAEIKGLKTTLEGQKQSLDSEKGSLERTVQLQYSQKQQSQAARTEQEYFLGLKTAEKEQYLKEKDIVEKNAAEIRAKIIDLIGIPIGQVPEFGELIEIANNVAKITNIRPAFLLGIISQESALGRNIGQCYVTNSKTGGGVFISGGRPLNRIMHATRDLPIFLRIAGSNFKEMPVSCWIPVCYNTKSSNLQLTYSNITINSSGDIVCPAGYAPYGFGGAMGPAQFIPSTWQLYEARLKSLFGIAQPNPWNVRDALAASSLYLSELGATAKTRTAEISAANRYFGSSYSGYGNQVLERADCVQTFINNSTMSQACQNLLGLRLR